ncbi:hypothetical protein HDU98_009264 [Podochytrium sp. JEL0797]|nr:hypothetical protein HDU98_009264 [Podochytrium sp. JEL0797]
MGGNGKATVRKRETHIASEQRRRQHIKDGFKRLSEQLAWTDEGGAATQRSEVAILQRSIEYIRELLDDQRRLEEQLGSAGVPAIGASSSSALPEEPPAEPENKPS